MGDICYTVNRIKDKCSIVGKYKKNIKNLKIVLVLHYKTIDKKWKITKTMCFKKEKNI